MLSDAGRADSRYQFRFRDRIRACLSLGPGGVPLALSSVFYPVGLWRWADSGIVLAVSLAIFAACATASFVALSLPWLLNRLGIDPAFGRGPLATVIQDLLSVIIYLVIATAMVR